MRRILLALAVALLLVIPLVSASDWDNIKFYDEEKAEYLIKDNLGLKDLATVKLVTPHINKVFYGNNRRVAELDVEIFEDDYNKLGATDTYWVSDMKETSDRNIKYRYRVFVENETIPSECEWNKERTECTTIKWEIHPKYEWREFNDLSELPEGKVRVGIYADVLPGDNVEWIPYWFGESLEEYAVWVDSFNTDLEVVYTFEEASGNPIDMTDGDYNATANSADYGATGVNGSAYSFVRANNDQVGMPSLGTILSNNFTINYWIDSDSDGAEWMVSNLRDDYDVRNKKSNADAPGFECGGQTTIFASETIKAANGWYMVTIVKSDGDGMLVYLNGTLVASDASKTGACSADTGTNQISGYTGGGGGNPVDGDIDEYYIWDTPLNSTTIEDLYNGGTGIFYNPNPQPPNEAPTIDLNIPADNHNITTNSVTFNCSATDDVGVLNVTLQIDGLTNTTVTNTTANENLSLQTTLTLAEGDHNWSCKASDTNGAETQNATWRLIGIDLTDPVITYDSLGVIGYHEIDDNLTINFTATDTHLDTCIVEYGGSNTTVQCAGGNISLSMASFANKSAIIWANDTYGRTGSNTSSWTYNVFLNANNFNSSTYETKPEEFDTGFDTDTTASVTGIWYNGTLYSGNNYSFASIPLLATANSAENRSWFWDYTVANGTTKYQYVMPINLTNCTSGTEYFNITAIDEKTLGTVQVSILNDWDYYIGDGSIYRESSFQDTDEQETSWKFCFLPLTETVTVVGTSSFENASYPQRDYAFNSYTYDNVTDELTVYMLSSSDGIYTTFQVVTPSGTPIQNVFVTANTTVSGSSIQIDSGYTGADGGITFWVNPDASHDFLFSVAGYTDVALTLTPTQSQYTVYMGETGNGTVYDFQRGISYSIEPLKSELTNATNTYFNFTLDSAYWTVAEYGFALRNSTTQLGYNTTTANNDPVILNISTGNDGVIVMDYFWRVGGNYTNMSRTWVVRGNVAGGEYGLSRFFSDLRTYTDDEIFGLNAWARTLIIFFIIFIIIGIAAYYTGMYSPAAISVMLFGLVAFFDAVLGLIPAPAGAVSNFATIFTFFIMAIILVWEAMK